MILPSLCIFSVRNSAVVITFVRNHAKTTEENSRYNHLEQMSVHDLLTNINREDKTVADTIEKIFPR